MIVEMGSRKFEREQTPEQILEVVNEAVETNRDVLLTQLKSNGEPITNIVIPVALKDNFLEIVAGEHGFDVDLRGIVQAEIAQ